MKKYICMAALFIVAALTLASCGDDEPKETVTATATYNMSFSQDLLNACNVFISYIHLVEQVGHERQVPR